MHAQICTIDVLLCLLRQFQYKIRNQVLQLEEIWCTQELREACGSLPSQGRFKPQFSARSRWGMSDQGANRGRWSEADNELLLSMRRRKNTWEVIQQRFPKRTLASLRQRYSTLNNRSTPGNQGRTRGR
ncbi:uncharacterized protein MCYG_08458 [Microsporum canis CBS 113480]|uniref:Myb-like domain-containing protein n=1 Tax=Arthroderma otae (strain ATCC MYA-4605 / CBS 113480) TaxID=554155 RepID=C5G0I6_ARTOC|nr:uncharacterized protein MCYG_08458 [Microsporum canis CBS 113480]EEQ35639.1 predicted protein [Microsporum canis CBS 113480]